MEKIKTVNRIRYLRQVLQLSQRELGQILDVKFQTISEWERERVIPSFEEKERIAKALGVPFSVCFPGG